MEHKTVTFQNGTVHYWLDRAGADAPCLVFTHGLTADHTMFAKQAACFSGRATLLLWDVPLHGLSRPYRHFSYRETALVLHAILEAEGIQKVFLIGMSMGGYPSQHFAALYPDMVQGFIALDTTPLGPGYYSASDVWWLRRAAPMARLFPTGLLRWSMARSVAKTDYSYQTMRTVLAASSKADIIEQMRVAYEYFLRENRDISLSCPVLLLAGERDTTGKVLYYCRQWAEKTGFPLHLIPNAAHFSNGDNPEAVNAEIERFVAAAMETAHEL